jgi:bla regulator protein BlaR1
MIDFFVHAGLSNACFALVLAIVAMVVGVKARRPHLTHMLWLLVLVKLVTPPIVNIPLVALPAPPEITVAMNGHSLSEPPLANNYDFDLDTQPTTSLWQKIKSETLNHGKEWLMVIWLLGSTVIFAWSMVRVCRFSRLLMAESEAAP